MWIRLDLEGIDFNFRISKYRQSTKEKWDDEWCKIDLTLQASDWLNYHIVSDEIMLASEVEKVRDKINDLLLDKLDKPEIIECIEPDLEFHLFPMKKTQNNPDIALKSVYENAYVDMDLQISFWDRNGELTANRLLLVFGKEDLKKMLCYLRYITGMADDRDEKVQMLLMEGYMYE